MNPKDEHKYDDIIHLPHHVSERRAPMSMTDRAAQFSPFAALTGYDATIQETGRLTDARIELDEGGKALLDEKLRRIASMLDTQPTVTLTCFRPDERKTGGAYIQVTGRVKKIDPYEQALVLTDKTAIPIDEIYDIALEEQEEHYELSDG